MKQEYRLLDDPEFMKLARICVTTRCTYNEAIRIIKRSGYEISSKTYQRAKTEIERTQKDRINQLADEFPQYAANTIDTAIAIDLELWTIVKTAKNTWEKLKALEMIGKNCKEKSDYYESSPVLAKFVEKLKDKKSDPDKSTTVETETKKSDEVDEDNVGKNSEAGSN